MGYWVPLSLTFYSTSYLRSLPLFAGALRSFKGGEMLFILKSEIKGLSAHKWFEATL